MKKRVNLLSMSAISITANVQAEKLLVLFLNILVGRKRILMKRLDFFKMIYNAVMNERNRKT